MKMLLKRVQFRGDGIFGHLSSEDGKFFCQTLEHSYLIKGNWQAKVLPGTYTCKRYMSSKFHFEVFELENVFGAKNIEIHPGNYNADSEGCILVGEAVIEKDNGEQVITNSKVTFGRLMWLQRDVDEFQLEIL